MAPDPCQLLLVRVSQAQELAWLLSSLAALHAQAVAVERKAALLPVGMSYKQAGRDELAGLAPELLRMMASGAGFLKRGLCLDRVSKGCGKRFWVNFFLVSKNLALAGT